MSKIKSKYWKIYRFLQRKIDPFPHINYVKKNNFIFIHIPKTAGTSVLDALSIKFRQHYDYRVYKAANPKLFQNSFKFCFVRNPYDRLISTYNYLIQPSGDPSNIYLKEIIEKQCPTFEHFVNSFINEKSPILHPLCRPQCFFIYDIYFTCKVDFIGRFEDIDRDFEKVCDILNIKCVLPKKNKSKTSNNTSIINEELANTIYSYYKHDFELFGYDKESWRK